MQALSSLPPCPSATRVPRPVSQPPLPTRPGLVKLFPLTHPCKSNWSLSPRERSRRPHQPFLHLQFNGPRWAPPRPLTPPTSPGFAARLPFSGLAVLPGRARALRGGFSGSPFSPSRRSNTTNAQTLPSPRQGPRFRGRTPPRFPALDRAFLRTTLHRQAPFLDGFLK